MFFCKCKTLYSPYIVVFKEVDSCKFLRVRMSWDITYGHIFSAAHDFYRKSNDCPSLTIDHVKVYIFSMYCLDVYGSNMWEYSSQYVKISYVMT